MRPDDPLTPAEAIAVAAILDANPRALPHWKAWAERLRRWGQEHLPTSENPSQDGRNDVPSGRLGVRNEAVPEVRQHQGDLTASPRPTETGGDGL